MPGGEAQAAGHLLEAHLAAVLVRARPRRTRRATRARRPPAWTGRFAPGSVATVDGRGRRSGLRFGSSTVPFEQIGHSATKRLWRQNCDTQRPNLDARLATHARPMRTAVVSDLHLGGLAGADVARDGRPLAALAEAVADADRLVLLGDVVELRERPLAQALEVAAPAASRRSAARWRAGRSCSCPGNHDHALAEPWLARLRLDGDRLPSDGEWPVEPERRRRRAASPTGCPTCELTLAYPGLRLRPDVYATHGHYLDLHLTIPRLESIAASAMGRLTGRGRSARSAADYEAMLAPMYAFYAGLAQGASAAALARGGSLSRTVWKRAASDPDGDGALTARASAVATRFLLGRVTIPGAVAALNGLGLGPFSASSRARSCAAPACWRWARVAEVLAPGRRARDLRPHPPARPAAGDDLAEWTTLSGTRLWNTGSWLHEGAFVRAGREEPLLARHGADARGRGPARGSRTSARARRSHRAPSE